MLTGAKSLLTGDYGEERSASLIIAAESEALMMDDNNSTTGEEGGGGIGGADDDDDTGTGGRGILDEEQQAASSSVEGVPSSAATDNNDYYDTMKETAVISDASSSSESVVIVAEHAAADGGTTAADGGGNTKEDNGSESDGGNGSGSGNGSTDGDGDDGDDDEGRIVKGEEKNPWSRDYVGIPVNYFSVGVIYGGSVSVLYPILVIQHGVSSSFYAAASSLVTIFWSYKIFFGFLSDCLPIRGQKWKPYIMMGWMLCAAMLIVLASMGENISPTNLVVMLTFANLGYVMADVAADGFMVWMAHHEAIKRRGKIQGLIYLVRSIGRIFINIVIIFAFSGPMVSCPGYEPDPTEACTTDETVAARNDMYDEENPNNTWCYEQCESADFAFGMTIPQFAWLIAGINLISMPTYFLLKEEKKVKDKVKKVLSDFWVCMKRRAVYQVMLYTMVSSITFNVFIAAKQNANYVWLELSTVQNQVLNIVESLLFAVGLALVRQYGLNFSWRKMIWIGSLMVTFFNLLYLLIVFDVYRNTWFYVFTDVTDTFMYTLNFMASVFAIVEVSEPGFEAITYSLITTANNATIPLSIVIAYQFMALFPSLNEQESLATDTAEVRRDFALLILIVEVINLSSLLALPMLPRQKKETQELMAKGETSKFWAQFTLISATIFLLYSTIVTFMTVAGADKFGCYKILGGSGCSDDESSIPVYILMGLIFLYCYGVNFYFSFWPILKGEKKFSFGMFF